MAFAMPVQAQTLFSQPDTTPNYASYPHIEECLTATFRITEAQERQGDSIWWDTLTLARTKELIKDLGIDTRGRMRPRSDSVIQVARACLGRFNADTATFVSLPYGLRIMEALLMANRDQDAQRFADRLLDSMNHRSSTAYKDALQDVLRLYTTGVEADTRPVRFTEAQRIYTRLLATVKGDSLYRTINAHRYFSIAAEATGDTALRNELWWHAIRANDSTPVEERLGSPLSTFRLRDLAGYVIHFTQNEGLDSLAVSTVAYNLWLENTVNRRVRGGAPVTAADEGVKPYKMPDLHGDYSYTATPGASLGPSSQGLASYTKQSTMPPGALPVRNRINLVAVDYGFCHAEQPTRGGDREAWNGCLSKYVQWRRIKEGYPEIEIVVLSYTYGTVGQMAPLQPEDEADIKAKRMLGHHRVPAHLVIEKTPFFHVEAPDERRIDLPTAMREELGEEVYGCLVSNMCGLWLFDKEGYRVKLAQAPSTAWFDRMYEILKNRPGK